MVHFLIHRPIAVIMTFIAVLTLGLVALGVLPISLMPDIDIPEITLQVNRPGESPRQIEEGVVAPLRYQLMQVPQLEGMQTESRDGRALIRLRFNYGADINYAFIDVNERTDEALRHLPADMERPAIVKATASDLPVFYINVWMEEADPQKFMELSDLARSVLVKRLEQLQEVALVDVTGQMEPELFIEPNEALLQSLGLTHQVLTRALEQNNLSVGSIEVADGQYRFNIRFSNRLRTVEDVRDVRLLVGDRMMRLDDLAEVGLRPRKPKGGYFRNQTPALSLAVIKQSDARMDVLKEHTEGLLSQLRRSYPGVHFEVVRDQTSILDYAISNLQSNLLVGGILAFFILFFFLKDARSPWLIGISVPVSLVMSLLFFHLTGLSLNIISLSGLILGIGMIIDNSIIVIDNITHYREEGESLSRACVLGTNEVIRPLISSVLTTCAVFVPLVFISGVSGALFYDQAMAVGIGLLASLLVSVTLIPVLYHLFNRRATRLSGVSVGRLSSWLQTVNLFKTEHLYERGFNRVFKHRRVFMLLFLSLLVPGFFLAFYMQKERFPVFSHDDVFVDLDWNEGIHLDENKQRVQDLLASLEQYYVFSNSYVGGQNYVLHRDVDLSVNQARVYFKCASVTGVGRVREKLADYVAKAWPGTVFSFSAPETVFEKLFQQETAPLVLQLTDRSASGLPDLEKAGFIAEWLNHNVQGEEVEVPAHESYLELHTRHEMMALYEVDYQVLFNRLQSALNAWQIGVLHTGSHYVPMVIGNAPSPIHQLLNELKVVNKEGSEIPVNTLVKMVEKEDYKVLYGDAQGIFLPLAFQEVPAGRPSEWMKELGSGLKQRFDADVHYTGSWFQSREMLAELAWVLVVALVLLYFILAAQFESLSQPLILLIEVPLDVAGALFVLWLFGGSLNLMAMIGLVVMSGIVVNDSILKVDTINRLYRSGMPLVEAIREGGRRRLKPIIMTSITTILALVPVLWGSGMGSELQRPLALTVIGGMVLGTVVSLYFIPLCYYYLNRKTGVK